MPTSNDLHGMVIHYSFNLYIKEVFKYKKYYAKCVFDNITFVLSPKKYILSAI